MYKWVLGGDPQDVNNLQTTFCNIFSATWTVFREQKLIGLVGCKTGTNMIFVPGSDLTDFIQCTMNFESPSYTLHKWHFVNDGNAILDEEWGGWDNLNWVNQLPLHYAGVPPALHWDKKSDHMWLQSADQTGIGDGFWAWLRCVNFDGDELFGRNMEEFYMPDDATPLASKNCALLDIAFGINDGDMLLSTMGCCYHEFINGNVLLNDSDADIEDYLKWSNGNGDFYIDVYYQADATIPWACLDNTGKKSGIHRVDDAYVDSEGFNIQYITYLGLNSFGVQTQDGSALGYMGFSDDNVDGAQQKGGGKIIDYGSKFDGMYMGRPLTINDDGGVAGGAFVTETFYVAFDSASGMIQKEVGVDEDDMIAFAVDQNSPNPFNPSTSIGFTIPESGHVTASIFNVAGQKVDTLVDDVMSAGHHSVVWDASGYSNGVYFYTIESGDFSKTMKMTLLK